MKHTLTIEGTADEIRTALDKLTGRVDAPAQTTTAAPSTPASAPAAEETKAALIGDVTADEGRNICTMCSIPWCYVVTGRRVKGCDTPSRWKSALVSFNGVQFRVQCCTSRFVRL